MSHIAELTKQWAELKGCKYFYFDEITSTNTEAKKQGKISQTSPWIYIAASQSQGRGRGDNTWSSPKKGNALLSTWCYQLSAPAQAITAPLFGWAVYKALNDEFDIPLSIKAPNDIYSGDKKMAGLLIESISQGNLNCLYVGLGLNITDQPSDILESTCLSSEIGSPVSEERYHRLLENIYNNFKQASEACLEKELGGIFRGEILTALKAWPTNKVENIMSNGDLVLHDKTRVAWTQL